MGKERPDPNIMQERVFFGGLTALFAVLGLIIPIFLYVAPVPIGALTYRQGMRAGTWVAVIVALLAALFISSIGLVIGALLVLFLSLGLAIGGSMRENVPPIATLAIGTIISLIMFGALYYTGLNMLGINVVDDVFTQWSELVGPELQPRLDGVRDIFPAMTVVSAVAFTFLNMFGVRRILLRRGDEAAWFSPFTMWRLPAAAAVVFLAVWVAHLLTEGGSWELWLLNIFEVMRYFVLLFGVAIMLFFAREWGLHWALRTLLVLFGVATPAGHGAMLILGMLDAVFNLRYRLRGQD